MPNYWELGINIVQWLNLFEHKALIFFFFSLFHQ